ncbi:IS66 family insertion sequence element accessory protein TnpB [Clostridium kluyveri]|uniref:Transposase n=1 Tax=Clostridium kluyveri TaxID=1534 RepID=A0A1L5F404_CLOKL|nr:IS66 family insertion sequence element accessory protein TnpB [Clostridium kluyveri]APM37739.1 hypothetical protein BS101_02745 [Clostridium kluyveri]UZQ52235.1 IS66 family insertion sequence element accessory protein TnpB [Clostridium kluyveri]
MLNIDKVDTVYLACGSTDLRKSIDGLTLIVQMELNLNPFDKALFVFCNKQILISRRGINEKLSEYN